MDSHNRFKVFLDPFNLQIFIEHLLCHTLRQVPWLNKINPTWILISRFKLLFYSVRWLTFYCVCLNTWTVDKAQQSMGGSQGDTDRVLRAQSRQKSPPTSDNQRNTSRHTPRNISSVKRLILPVGRIRFLIHPEGFSRQSLDVLKPNTVMSGVRGGIISLTVGHRRVKKEKGAAFRNPPVTYFTSQKRERETRQRTYGLTHTSSRRCVPTKKMGPGSCSGEHVKVQSKDCLKWHFTKKRS